MGVDVARLDLERGAVGGLGPVELARCLQHVAEVVVGVDVTRLGGDRRAQQLETLLGTARLKRRDTAQVQGFRMIRLDAEHLSVQGPRLFRLAGLQKRQRLLQGRGDERGLSGGTTLGVAPGPAVAPVQLAQPSSFFAVHRPSSHRSGLTRTARIIIFPGRSIEAGVVSARTRAMAEFARRHDPWASRSRGRLNICP